MTSFLDKKRFLKLAGYCALAGLLSACNPVKQKADFQIIPQPQEIVTAQFPPFILRGGMKIIYPGGNERMKCNAEFLAGYLKAATGLEFPTDTGTTGRNAIILALGAEVGNSEGYRLKVTSQGVMITAATETGVFYGIQTLYNSLPVVQESGIALPVVDIKDTPRFAYRGMMMDVSRQFFPKDFIKRQIDVLALYKINRLHLHLTDATGWRLEIKQYPLLTEFAAWRTDADWRKWWNGERKYLRYDEPGASGGYYTRDDMKEIIAYAQQRYITVIPEIEMPSRSEEVLAAYPQLSCSGKPYRNADFCVGNEGTFTFLENILTEVMEIFPSEYIHIGGDEVGKVAWKTCPKCQKRMKEEHLANTDELQSYLIHRIEKFLNDHGRKMLAWDDILKGGPTPDATVMSWRDKEGGIAAVCSGHQTIIMTPGQYCYQGSNQDTPYSQPEAVGDYLPLEKAYSYEPVPDSLTEEQTGLVYGVQDNLWNGDIPTPEHMECIMHPRILALAEVAWSAPERKSWPDFHKRALKAADDLRKKGYHTSELK